MCARKFTEEELARDIWPRFARVRARPGIYLANHSLGRPPDRMADDVAGAVDAWYRDMDAAWDHWLDARERFRALVARLVGVPDPSCIVPRASAGQGLRAVLNALPGRPRVLTSVGEFDSIAFILTSYRDQGRIELAMRPWLELPGAGADLLVLSSVMFESGEIVADLPRLIATAHAQGTRVLLDVYHHAGVLPLDLAALDADFAVGGCYKYLRGGPGAGWLYVRPEFADALHTLDAGWFAKANLFDWDRRATPRRAPGGDGWLEATPAVLAWFQALAGLEFTLEAGVARLRAHNLAQKARLADLLAQKGVTAAGAGEEAGAFLTVSDPAAARLATEMRARGVVCDARGQHLRLGPDLLNTDAELVRAAAALGEILAQAASGG
ncbi:MAG: aminotransferase class V-fold PLP-dependent enzyme [Rhodocyclaceae bacterium]|nr:aminotransferase class V-fold PLP-dependent enzyme [Rhodocyclaceae bacterium]